MLTMRAPDPLIKLEIDLVILELHARGLPDAAIAPLVGLSPPTVGRRLASVPRKARALAADLVAEDGDFLTDAGKDRLRHIISPEWRRQERRQGLR